ncbi:zinc finger MYM-type protein 5-like [Trifolium pratense]|uniref:zinc finger MYM-type protein 5-like n=1 Tax=Trifolium pratense TaxID=57577 RepID=UPI001E693824|nr:zinc finger MYM-type protein 5-like [Trifolium pratense]XP_045827743.1 zinc finger MYM-type protein 5-like [Trifolium pratense]
MPPKIPPKFRKFESGNEKRKKKKKLEEFIQSQRGALDKFLIKEPQISIENENVGNVDSEILENVVENNNTENESVNPENRGDVHGDDVNLNTSLDNEDDDNLEGNVNDNVEQANPIERSFDIFDPRNWDALDSKMIDLLVMEGPKRDLSIVNGPKDKSSRRFTANLYTRTLANGEKWDRKWLVYSKELDRVFCFCCKVFKRGNVNGLLTNEGFCNWKHIGERLREHERGAVHIKNMVTWNELLQRLQKNQTIDKTI